MRSIFFSIIIPAKKTSDPALLKKCLTAIKKQTYHRYEIIIITQELLPKPLLRVLKTMPAIRHIQGPWSKSAARNIGAQHAKGNYLLHIDVDYLLHPNILEMAVERIKETQTKAIILHERIASGKSLWQQARALERQIAVDDLALAAPQLIEKKLFEDINGFDERVDALDDWCLALKLTKIGIVSERIPPLTDVYEPTNIVEIWRHRFHKGRYLPLLKKLYADVPQIDVRSRWQSYQTNATMLIKKPHVTSALVLLKFADLIPFFLGTLFPITLLDHTDIYQQERVARHFDTENTYSHSAAYKHYRESESLLALLGAPKGKVLELGAGTGRITQLLTYEGWNVLPTDISAAMLLQLQKKKGLPMPQLLTKAKLPFRKRQFAYVIGIRVIWHIMDQKKRELFFSEAIRAAKKGVIMDFTNKEKYNNLFIQSVLHLFFPLFFNQSYYFTLAELQTLAKKYNVVIEEIIPLEVLPPFWIPKKFFPHFATLETKLARVIPPGRFMIKLTLQ